MTGKIEKVATAIAKYSLETGVRDWSDVDDHDRAIAKIAIEAMKDPTEGMIDVGRRMFWCGGNEDYEPSTDEATEMAWQAMIDVALRTE